MTSPFPLLMLFVSFIDPWAIWMIWASADFTSAGGSFLWQIPSLLSMPSIAWLSRSWLWAWVLCSPDAYRAPHIMLAAARCRSLAHFAALSFLLIMLTVWWQGCWAISGVTNSPCPWETYSLVSFPHSSRNGIREFDGSMHILDEACFQFFGICWIFLEVVNPGDDLLTFVIFLGLWCHIAVMPMMILTLDTILA